MTITGTASPPQVIATIIEKLQATQELEGVLVRWGFLSTLPTDRERIYMLGTSDYVRSRRDGFPVREEDYLVRGCVEVSLITGDPIDVSNRLWALVDAIDLALLADPDLTYARYTGELRIIGDDVSPTTEGWFAQAFFRLGMRRLR